MSVLSFLKKTLSLDLRSLALYRILMGLIVMADVITRLPDITNLYTDIGLVPRALFTAEMSQPWSFSLHLANGSFGFIAFMFGLHLLFGIMLVVGFKSRWAMLGAFIMTVSVHNRNWLVNNGGDDILRAILFISIFLPLNRRFSIDSAMEKEKTEETDSFSTWGLTFFLQVFCIYFVSYILKTHAIWRTEWTAMFYSSRLDIFATPIGIWMRDKIILMKILTAFSIYLEWGGPLLLVGSFVFGKRWWIPRSLIVLMFIGFHFGIILTMSIGVFPYTCIAMWTIFFPGVLWDKIGNYFRNKNYGKISIYYDGECGFCLKGVKIIKEFFLLKEVPINKAQDFPSVYADMEKNHSWVIENENKERFFHFNAWIELTKHSPVLCLFSWFFASKPVSFIGQKIYVWISHHRPFMGKATQFLEYSSPKKEIVTLKWSKEFLGAFMFVTLFAWNLTTIKTLHFRAPFFQSVTRWLHLYQEWNMFAPFPKMDNVWIEIPATLSDGTEIELLSGDRDIYSIKDQHFANNVPNEHWRKFYLNVSDKIENSKYFGSYLCRTWNERKIRKVPNTTLRKMEIIVYSQPNLPDGDKGGISRKLSWKHWCFEEDLKRDTQGSN